jgi:uncharacterized cupin superfamily protein
MICKVGLMLPDADDQAALKARCHDIIAALLEGFRPNAPPTAQVRNRSKILRSRTQGRHPARIAPATLWVASVFRSGANPSSANGRWDGSQYIDLLSQSWPTPARRPKLSALIAQEDPIHGRLWPAVMMAADAAPRLKPSNYPEPFASRIAGRVKHPLGDLFGLTSFGVNLTRLPPGAVSALHHIHTVQDEFIYVPEGEPTLFTDASKTQLSPGMVAGFAAGGVAHHLENRTDRDCVILEIGTRPTDDPDSFRPLRKAATRPA